LHYGSCILLGYRGLILANRPAPRLPTCCILVLLPFWTSPSGAHLGTGNDAADQQVSLNDNAWSGCHRSRHSPVLRDSKPSVHHRETHLFPAAFIDPLPPCLFPDCKTVTTFMRFAARGEIAAGRPT